MIEWTEVYPMKKMTINRLAELAGTSRGTVDKVLHNRAGVSDEVRARVMAIIAEQNYVPPQHAAKADTEAVKKTIDLAVIIPNTVNEFFQKIKEGMDYAVSVRSYAEIHLEFFYCNSENVSEVLSILQYIAEHGFDGILIRGSQSGRLCDRLNSFMDNGVPVVLFDSNVYGCRKLCFVGEDSTASGRVAASLLATCIGEKGDVAVIGGMSEISGHRLRIQGFKQTMSTRFPDINIVETINSYDQSVIAYEKTIGLLKRYNNLRGIFCAVGCTADVGRAILDMNWHNVKVISYNMTPDIIMLVKKGVVKFTIGLTPFRNGMVAVNTLLDHLIYGKMPESDFIEMPLLLGMDENIDVLSQSQQM